MKKILLLFIVFFLNFSAIKAEEPTILPSQIGVVQKIEYVDNNSRRSRFCRRCSDYNSLCVPYLARYLYFYQSE